MRLLGRLTDKTAENGLFIRRLAIYLGPAASPGLSSRVWFPGILRLHRRLGIGGEYTAINSAIDELIPSRFRGPGGHSRQRHPTGPERC